MPLVVEVKVHTDTKARNNFTQQFCENTTEDQINLPWDSRSGEDSDLYFIVIHQPLVISSPFRIAFEDSIPQQPLFFFPLKETIELCGFWDMGFILASLEVFDFVNF